MQIKFEKIGIYLLIICFPLDIINNILLFLEKNVQFQQNFKAKSVIIIG